MFKKIVSTILIATLFITSFNSSLFSFTITSNIPIDFNNFGKITSASFYNSNDIVINIQDLHANKQVQDNIYNILKFLTDKYKNVEIFLEGASKPIQFDSLINSAGKENSKLFIENLYSNSDISGAEYFAYKNNKTLNAIEEKALYDKNIQNYALLLKNNKDILENLNRQYLEIQKANKKYLTKQQIDIIKSYNKYLNGKTSFLQFYKHISKYLNKQKIDISNYPELKLYLYILDKNNKVDETKIAKQLHSLILYLKSHLSYKEYNEILKVSNNFSNIDILLSYLFEHSYLNNYPQLLYYVQLKNLSSIIEPLYLVDQERSFINDLLMSYSKFSLNRNMIFINMFFNIYKNVASAQASYDDYLYYKYSKDNFNNLYANYVGITNESYDLDEYLEIAEEFNEINNKRNIIFINKILPNINNNNNLTYNKYGKYNNITKILSSLDDNKNIKIVVTGGFHTLGINKLLDENKVSYITITPNVSTNNFKYKEKYKDSILLQTNIYSNAIAGQPLFEQEAQLFVNNFVNVIEKTKLTNPEEIKKLFETVAKANNQNDLVSITTNDDELIFDITTDLNVKYTIIYNCKNNKVEIRNNTLSNSTALSKNIKTLIREILIQEKSSLGRSLIEKMLGVDISKIITGNAVEFSRGEESVNALLKYKSLLPNFADDIISALFKIDMVKYDKFNKSEKYELLETFKKVLSDVGGQEFADCEIIVGRSNKLIGFTSEYGTPENYGCLLYVVRDNNKAKQIYVADQLLDYILATIVDKEDSTTNNYLSEEEISEKKQLEIESLFRSIIAHERLENIALSGMSRSFNKYAKDNGYDRLLPETFHEFIKSKEFSNFFEDVRYFSDDNIQEQIDLLNNLDKLISEINKTKSVYSNAISAVDYNTRYIQQQEKKKQEDNKFDQQSTVYTDQDIQDFIDIRISLDNYLSEYSLNTVSQYISILIDKIKNQISSEIKDVTDLKSSNYCFVYRSLPNQEDFANIALLLQHGIKKKIGIDIDIVKIKEQRNLQNNSTQYYVEYTPEQIKENFDIAGKKIFYIDDILSKQSTTFYNIHELLVEKEDASKVQSCVFFDLSQEPKDENLLSDAVINKIINNPETLYKSINKLNGEVSKYVVPLLFEVYKKKPQSFNEIMKKLNPQVRTNVAKKLGHILNNNISIRGANNNDIFALIVCLLNGKYIDFSINSKEATSVINNIFNDLEKVIEKDNTENKVFNVNYQTWKGDTPLLVVYAKLRGYTTLNLSKFPTEKNEIRSYIFDYAKNYEMVVVDRKSKLKYEHQNSKGLQNKEIKKKIGPLREELSKAKQNFDNGINLAKQIKDNEKQQLQKIELLQADYSKAVKEIMVEVQNLVVDVLKKEGIPIDDKLFLVVVGGSLVKGNMKSDSDIYYDIIVPDGFTSIAIEQHFTPLFFSVLHEIGLNNYHTLKYSTARTTRNNINTFTDEREVVSFLNYEPLGNNKSNELYVKYMNEAISDTINSCDYNLSLIKNIISYYLLISQEGCGKFGQYSFLYSHSKNKSFTTKWTLKTFETFLNAIILEYIKDNPNIQIQEIPQSVGAQIEFIKEHEIFEKLNKLKKIEKIDADNLYNSWKILSSMRYLKQDSTWTPTTQAEIKARNTLNGPISRYLYRGNYKEIKLQNYNNVLEQIENFVYSNSTSTLVYRKGYDRYANVDKWMNFDKDINGVDYLDIKNKEMIADILKKLTSNTIRPYVFINNRKFDVNNGDGSDKKSRIELKLAEGNILKIYRDGSIKFQPNGKEGVYITNRKNILNLDCDNDLRYEIMEILDTLIEPALLWNKAKMISLLIDIDSEETREQLRAVIQDKGMLEDIFVSLDKIKQIETLPDIVDLQGERSLQNYWDSVVKICGDSPETFFALLSYKLTEVKYSQNTKDKALLFSVYLPLSKRLGMAEIYENVRNVAFESTNPTEYLSMLKILEAFFGDTYSEIFVSDEKVEIEIRKILKANGVNLDNIEITSRVKTLYSIYEKLTSTRRAEDTALTQNDIDVLKILVEDIKFENIELKDPETSSSVNINIDKLKKILAKEKEALNTQEESYCVDVLNRIKTSMFGNIALSEYFINVLKHRSKNKLVYNWVKEFLNSGVSDIIGLHVIAQDADEQIKVTNILTGVETEMPEYVDKKILKSIKPGKKNNSALRKKFKAKKQGKRQDQQIELCVYTKEDHDKETYGIYNTEGQTKRPHNIYKVGKGDKNVLYLDNIFPAVLDLNYFDDIDMEQQTFVFESDNFVPNSDIAQNHSKVYELLENKIMCVVEYNNKVYIVALPEKSTIFDLVSCKEFSDDANKIVYDQNGNYVEANTKLDTKTVYSYRIFSDDYPVEVRQQDIKTIRGQIIYDRLYLQQSKQTDLQKSIQETLSISQHDIDYIRKLLKGTNIFDKQNVYDDDIIDFVNNNHFNKDISKDEVEKFILMVTRLRNKYNLNKISLDNFLTQSIKISNHYNLKNVVELFEALEYGIINVDDIKHYFYTEYVITTKGYDENKTSSYRNRLISKLEKMFEIKQLGKFEYSKHIISIDGVKYSINKKEYENYTDYQMQQIILSLDEFEKHKDKFSFKTDFIKTQEALRLMSLGNNIEQLVKYANVMYPNFVQQIIDTTLTSVDDLVTSMKVLLGLYSEDSQDLSQESPYITQEEIDDLQEQIIDNFKQKGFNVNANIKISNTQALVLNPQTYSFATLQVERNNNNEYENITLFLNEEFVKEIYNRQLDMQEILSFVVEHELEEYEYIMQGKTYKQYHQQANEQQQNLLMLCDDIAQTISNNYVNNAYNEIIDFFGIEQIDNNIEQVLYETINKINDYVVNDKSIDFNILKSLLVVVANMGYNEKINLLAELQIKFSSKEAMLKTIEQYSDSNKYLLTQIIELLFVDPVFDNQVIDNDIEPAKNNTKHISQLLSAA